VSQFPASNLPPAIDPREVEARLLAPARRASVMLFIFGALAFLGGLMVAIVPWLMPPDQILAESRKSMPQLPPNITTGEILGAYTFLGVFAVIVGVVLIVVGFFVRRGRRWACITALALCSLGIAYFMLNLLMTFGQGMQDIPRLAAAACFGAGVIALLLLASAWLVRAIGMTSQRGLMQQQIQMQLWQIQQPPVPPPTSDTGWQRGYGMSPPPPPPAG
jgi:hypothetical protein